MHGKGQVRLALGSKHTGGGKARIIDQQWIGVAFPSDGIRRVGDNGLKRFIIPVCRIGQRVPVGDVELLKIDVVQKHVDAAQVVGGQIDFLTEKALPHIVLAQHLGKVQQQRTGTAGGVVYFIDLSLAQHGDARQQFGNFLRGVKLPTGLPGSGGVHLHEVFIGITKQVNGIAPEIPAVPQGQIADGFQQHHQLFIALLDDRSQLVAVDVHLREQPLEVVFAVRTDCRTFNVGKNTAQGFIEIVILPGLEPYIVEQLGRQDIEPLFTHDLFAPVFRILVTQQRVVEIFIPGPRFLGIQITGQILRQKPIK